MNIDKICRCCLALEVPLLSIYDGGSAGMGCVADMLKQIAKLMPRSNDNMPEKACLQCISEINRCFVFKMKCENSNRTLRQLLPNAVPEPLDLIPKKANAVSSAVQTDDKIYTSSMVQTVESKPLTSQVGVQTVKDTTPFVSHIEVQTQSELQRDASTSFGSHENLESFFIFEANDLSQKPDKKLKKRAPSPDQEQANKKICLEGSSVIDISHAIEEGTQIIDQQSSAYILLEDSNFSQETDVSASNSVENKQYSDCEEYEYYGDVEEFQNEQTNDTYEEDIPNENLETHSVYDIERLDGKTKSDEEAEAEAIAKHKINNRSKPKGQYKCSQCIMTFVSMKVLKRHLANRHDIKDADLIIDYLPPSSEVSVEPTTALLNSGVELTPENVAKPQLLPMEKTTAVNEELLANAKYFCKKCNSGFAQRKTLTYHVKNQVCMKNNFKCNICESIFVSEENLKTHKLTHENPHKCLECDTVCKTIEDLSQHMITTHNRNARNQCHVCKKVFTMKTSLVDHLRIHSGEKPFLCTICGKSFRQNSNLRQHIIRHTNERNFKCDMCPNAYITKSELFSHKRTHTGEHPFKCDICQARFTTSCALKKHERKHTGERPYACEFCPMRFAVLNVLKNHRRIHTGEKPYKCVHCSKTFTQKGDCLIHERTHLHENYKCFCKSSFMKKSNLTYHIKTRHSEYSEKEIQSLLKKTTEDVVETDLINLIETSEENFLSDSEEKTCTSNNKALLDIVIEKVG